MKTGDLVRPIDGRIGLHSHYLIHPQSLSIPWFWNQIGIILEITNNNQNSFSGIKRSCCKILIPAGIGWCSPELVNIKIIHSLQQFTNFHSYKLQS